MNRVWTDEQKDLLLEIYQREGHYDLMRTFGNDRNRMKDFFEGVDMKSYALDYERASSMVDLAMTVEERTKALAERENAARILYEAVKLRLNEAGIDCERNFGKDLTDDEKAEMVRKRLREFGVPPEEVNKVNASNVNEYIDNDKDFQFELDDTPAAREFCRKEDIAYEVRGDKLYMQGSIHFEKCMAVPDTEEHRRILNENGIQFFEMEYADMAQGKRGDFLQDKPAKMLAIPFAWMANGVENMTNKFLNNNLRTAIVAGTALAGFALFPVQPHMVFLAWCLMVKLGLFKKRQVEAEARLNFYESRAAKAGNTVYKEVRKDGRKEGVYVSYVNGNMIRIPARDVRIPMEINGVRLNYAQREIFRKGELLTLKKQNGEEFAVRIDLTNPKMYAMYGKAMRSDKHFTAVPAADSDDKDKLEYISRKGVQGVRDIYGDSRVNLQRDGFLNRYSLKQTFWMAQNAEERLKIAVNDTQKSQATAEIQKADKTLRESAYNFVLSQSKGRSL